MLKSSAYPDKTMQLVKVEGQHRACTVNGAPVLLCANRLKNIAQQLEANSSRHMHTCGSNEYGSFIMQSGPGKS